MEPGVCGQGHERYRTNAGRLRCNTCDREAARHRYHTQVKGKRVPPLHPRVLEGSGRWERTEQLIARGWPLERIAEHLNVPDTAVYRVADRMDEAVRG